MIRTLTIVMTLLMIGGALSACGKKGPPEAPSGSTYPREYPADS